MPCMSGIFRSSTMRSTGSIANRSMASRPLPACVDFTFRNEPSDVITMRLIVGESSTTRILFVLISSGIDVFAVTDYHLRGQPHGPIRGFGLSKGSLFYGKVRKIAKGATKSTKIFLHKFSVL